MEHLRRGKGPGLPSILFIAASIGAAALTSPGPSLGAAAPERPMRRVTTGGPDTYGYRFIDNINEAAGPSFDDLSQDISTTGTLLGISGDESSTSFTLPMLIRFYGQNWGTAPSGSGVTVVSANIGVSSNCFLQLLGTGQAASAGPWSNTTLPASSGNFTPGGFIAVLWDDGSGDGNASARWEIVGTAPNRRLIVQWTNWAFFGSGGDMTLQAQITESDGVRESDIYLVYQNIDNSREGGDSATIGIQAPNATSYLQYSYNTANSTTPDTSTTPPTPRVMRFYAGQPPNPPTGLLQAAEAGGPAWPVNFISDATVYLRGTVTDPDTGDRVGLEVEILPSGTPFQTDITGETARTAPADLVLNGGEPEALYTFTGSPFGSGEYHWRARSFDANGNTSAWATYDPAATHIRVDLDPPTIPEAVYPLQDRKVSAGGDRFVWLLSEDVGPPGPIKYEFEADNSESFTNLPVADFAIDETRGILVLPLSRDPFFWHVRAIDRAGNASPWSPTIRFFTKGDDGIDHAAGDAPDNSAGCSAGQGQASNGALLLLGLLAVAGVRISLARRVPQE